MRHHLTPVRMDISKMITANKFWHRYGKKKKKKKKKNKKKRRDGRNIMQCCGNVNLCSYYGKQYEGY